MKKQINQCDNFISAVKRLNEVNIEYKKHSDSLIYQDSLIKRFEFTFELSWKSLKEYLSEQGFKLTISSPKGIIAAAYQENIINNEQIWLDMLESRNLSAHDYGQDFSAEIANSICYRYCKELTALSKFFIENLK